MHLTRRHLLAGLAGLALAPLSSACKRAEEPLVVASHVWPGYELMFLAQREGWLPQQGISLIETNSATVSRSILTARKADGAALTLDEVLRLRVAGESLTVVLVFDVSAGADVVLARAGIDTLRDLAGKRIAAERSGLGALMLHKVLKAAGLPLQAVTAVSLPVDDHFTAWRQGRIDAAITFEPFASRLREQGAHVLFDSRQIPDTIIDVLAVRESALRSRARALSALVAAHFRALAHFRANPRDAAHRIAPHMKLTGPEALEAFRGIVLPDIAANRQYLGGTAPSLLAAARSVSSILVAAGILPREDDLTNLVSDAFLPEAGAT
jgi:NitT/TauT family transport system substrate-binding protein